MIKYNKNDVNECDFNKDEIVKMYYNNRIVHQYIEIVKEYYLTVNASAFGKVVYGTEETTDGTRVFRVKEGEEVTLTFVPGNDFTTIDSVKINNVETTLVNNEYVISGMEDNVTVDVVFKDASANYLTITATSDGILKKTHDNTVWYWYSVDGIAWLGGLDETEINVSAGDKVRFRGELVPANGTGIGCFSASTCTFEVEGNPMSLLYGENFTGVTTLSGKDYAFEYLFKDCTGLTSINGIALAATTTAPYCCHGMFQGCTGLTDTPLLPAETLAEGAYYQMFNGCTSLSGVTCYATSFGTDATTEWLKNVAASGVFTKKAGASWSSGEDGIPTGWTVEEI